MKCVSISGFKMPTSCTVCQLKNTGTFSKEDYCVFEGVNGDVSIYLRERHKKCPLKEEEIDD